jgi:ADP-ribose pyrophosphatase
MTAANPEQPPEPSLAEPYRTLATHYLSQNRWRNFREDVVDIGGGRQINYSYAEVPAAVFVVPLTHDGQIVLIRQYRYPVRDWVLEVPAGSLANVEEEASLAARRELLEEVGGVCEGEMLPLARFYSSSAHINLASQIFLATEVHLEEGLQQLEETELLQRVILPAHQAIALAQQGGITEGQSAYAVLLAAPHILARENETWLKK